MANNRKSINLLPAFFRTEKNNKFLSSTLDQLISVPQLNRIDAYVGSKYTPTYQPGDVYITDTNPLREAYQLEPALIVKTLDQEIKKAFALDDLLNQINIRGGDSSNLDRLLNPKFFPYDPKIDWDKFINFRSYYWLPNGPDAVLITGDQRTPTIEFSVTDNSDGIQFLFGGVQTTENLTLYRGYTYVFNIDSIHNFYIKYKADLISFLVIVSTIWFYSRFSRVIIASKELMDCFNLTLIFLTFVMSYLSVMPTTKEYGSLRATTISKANGAARPRISFRTTATVGAGRLGGVPVLSLVRLATMA
jgi:hypothetical protein